jgi:hypothetical protein
MTTHEAFNIVHAVTGMVALKRADHEQLKEALSLLKGLAEKKK